MDDSCSAGSGIRSVDLDAAGGGAHSDNDLAAFVDTCERYQTAIFANDADELTARFLPDRSVVRFGFGESLWSFEEITAFIRNRSGNAGNWTRRRARATLYRSVFGCFSAEFVRPDGTLVVRVSQSWMLADDRWQIVHAHLSQIG